MNNWYKSSGVITYGSKVKRLPTSNSWWIVLDCCNDLICYYKQMTEKGYGIKLLPVSWGAHITVVYGEEPPVKDKWNLYDGQKVQFEYSNQIGNNGEYYWLPVVSQELSDIRASLGLSPIPRNNFHLTLGKKYCDIYYDESLKEGGS